MAKPGAGDRDIAGDSITPDAPDAPRPEDGGGDDGGRIGSDRPSPDAGVHSDRVGGPQDRTSPQDDLLQSTELPDAPRRPR